MLFIPNHQHFASDGVIIATVTTTDLTRHVKNFNGSQRACLAVELHNNEVTLQPTLAEWAKHVGTSAGYAREAATLSAEQRHQMLRNRDAASVASILRARRREHVPSDTEVRLMILRAGPSRVLLEMACMAESTNIVIA
jgi:hypothetical protein